MAVVTKTMTRRKDIIFMNTDVVIVGAGPAGIFTAIEMLRKGSKRKLSSWKRVSRLKNAAVPKPRQKMYELQALLSHYDGLFGRRSLSDGKLSSSYEVGGDLPTLIGEDLPRKPLIIPISIS